MIPGESEKIISAYYSFLNNKAFPCVGAKAAMASENIKCMVADHMACPKDDHAILQFLYKFVDDYRLSPGNFHSVAILFAEPLVLNEDMFDRLLWTRLQSLADLDGVNYNYDKRVSDQPSSVNFSFSLKEEAFYIIGLHSASSRKSRQFSYPALIFNPHAQFEELKTTNRYNKMKATVRKRDIALSGTVNPMLDDFGKTSEVLQYSGRVYIDKWKCPLNINHGKSDSNSSS
jgi:FPC/CPF motif-containing protein YcgG